MKNPYVAFASNNAWANRTLYDAVARLSQAAFVAEAPGFFPSLAATLNHIHEVDLYYIDALTEDGLGRSVYDREDIDDARTWVRRRPRPTRGCFRSACRSPTPTSTAACRPSGGTA
jgi:uncharacterized damage-inducible protein DinB